MQYIITMHVAVHLFPAQTNHWLRHNISCVNCFPKKISRTLPYLLLENQEHLLKLVP